MCGVSLVFDVAIQEVIEIFITLWWWLLYDVHGGLSLLCETYSDLYCGPR